MPRLAFGLDASFSRIDWDAVLGALPERPRVYVQCLWTGGFAYYQTLLQVAEHNLRGARERGIITAGYINASPWFPAELCFEKGRQAAGAEWGRLSRLAVDVELPGIRLADVKRLCELCAQHRPTCIYTGRWFWVGHMNNAQDAWLLNYPLWAAQYDGQFNLNIVPYGPSGWRVVGKQYGGGQVAGSEFDWNAFDMSWWGGDSMPNLSWMDEQMLWKAPAPNWGVKVRMGSVADFYRALARGEAWTLKDDMQDAIIQQLLRRVEKLEQELAARSAPVSRAEIIDALIAALKRLKESEGR
jgi:uncharacterized protein CbrC (UPF0167 family)